MQPCEFRYLRQLLKILTWQLGEAKLRPRPKRKSQQGTWNFKEDKIVKIDQLDQLT